MTTSATAVSSRRPPLSRPMALGTHGVISTGQTLATQAGLRVLQDGGSAVDAALAASAVLAVVRPHAATIGGDLFALVHDGRGGAVTAVNSSGPAPRAATAAWFRSQGYQTMPPQGILSIEVPGFVDGWFILHERYATWSAADLWAPAIRCAEEGFPVYAKLAAESARHAALLAANPATAARFLPDGQPLRPGQLLVQAELAECLRAIAREGRGAYYGGPIGAAIGRYCQSAGGLLAESDLATPPGAVLEPLRVDYRGYTVYETPPVSQGFLLLSELNIANGLDLGAGGHNSVDAIHLMVETKKLAFADRLAYLGDPARVSVPLDALLSPEYGARQRARIDPERAANEPVAAYDLASKGTDTTYLCVGLGGRRTRLGHRDEQPDARLLAPGRPSQPARTGQASDAHAERVPAQAW
jgi:gamma-glutamyltranspeptidase/glutathione hydrolase